MLDAVQAALEPKEASPASIEPGQEAAKAEDPAKTAEGESEDELSDEELKALSWKTQKRFKGLTTALKTRDGEIAELKPKAAEFDRMVDSISKANLDTREVDELIEVGGMLKSNPHAALAKMLPIVQALQSVVGETLPPELQERVRLGYISEADARELNKARASTNLLTRREQETQQQAEQREQQNQLQTHVTNSIKAVEGWEKQQADKDPDWHLKRKEVAEQVELAIQREAIKRNARYFPTAEESVKLAADALKTINERLKRFSPKPNDIRPTTPGASTRTKPTAKTTLEAINAAMG